MPIVSVEDFHPKTGAYWQGWTDYLDGKPCQPPARYDLESISDYNQGYENAKRIFKEQKIDLDVSAVKE